MYTISTNTIHFLEMDSIETKFDNALQYTNKFINKGKHSESYRKSHTNSYSDTGSRPGHENGIMQFNRMTNQDIIHYGAIDYNPDNDAHRKTGAPKIVSFNHIRTNTQKHFNNFVTMSNSDFDDQSTTAKLIHLPDISEKIFLADYNSILNHMEDVINHDISVVIDLSRPLSQKSFAIKRRNNIKCHNIYFQDTRNMDYKDFLQVTNKVIDIINTHIDKTKIVICCEKGVNRSVAIIVAYALRNGKTLEEAINYIVKRKNDNNWPVLNNLRFYHFLQIMEQKMKN